MNKLYVVCNDYKGIDECVCCICGSRAKAEAMQAQYEHNFIDSRYEWKMPKFWIREIPAKFAPGDYIEFD